jgi:small subunit ribosomal protein S18
MTSKKNRARAAKEPVRKPKKKTSVLITERVEYIDYKDTDLLQRFLSDRSKIRGRRVNGNDEQQQREIAAAIKNAREMALLPYTKRVASAGRGPRGPREDRGDRGDRGERGDRDTAPVDETATTEVETVEEAAE